MTENKSPPGLSRELLQTILLDQWKTFWDTDRGIERDQLSSIKKYTSSPHAIVISGLRRVGKSTLLAQIGAHIGQNHVYYINFEDERLTGVNASSLQYIHEILRELFGERLIFLFDEIQNVKGWERFVRRMIDEKYKFYITGSNASLLSRELGTRLTGRYIPIELFPFSFREFLVYLQHPVPHISRLTTKDKTALSRAVLRYMQHGGIPDALKYPELPIHRTIYDDALYRDIAARYQITELRALKELSHYCISNVLC